MVTTSTAPLIDTDFDAWLTRLPLKLGVTQQDTLRRAYTLSTARGHSAANLLVDLGMDHEVLAGALLHQTVEQGRLTLERLTKDFGPAIAKLVESTTRLDIIGNFHQQGPSAQAQQLENLRKMLLAMAQDVRAVIMKLAIRLARMRTVDAQPEPERQRLAQETLDIFTPLANRLGMGRFKWELEDLALRHLEPATYKKLARALDERRTDREHYIIKVVDQLKLDLQQAGIPAHVSGRAKHIYGIWRKMRRKQLPFEQIFDIHAVRVMVDTVNACYAALGVVHAQWNHIPAEFDDYIAHPKDNGYQSLHTAVIGPSGKILEVQIRTCQMHDSAELGVAAHWRYKEGGGDKTGNVWERQLAWLKQLLEWKDEPSADFLDRFKTEIFEGRVFAVTPKGTIIEMQQGATPLDFAYHIHTEVGHRCRGAKVNGRIVPLTYELHNGEQVEILTTKQGAPSRDWLRPHLGYLKTSRALAKVRVWFRHQDQEKNVLAGRAALEREFRRLDVSPKQVDLQQLAEELNCNNPDELFAAIGYGSLTPGQISSKLHTLVLPTSPNAPAAARKTHVPSHSGHIRIRGVGQLLTQPASCCKPAPFEPIAGFVTRGRGVSIHRQDCSNLLDLVQQHPERIIEVNWDDGPETTYPVSIRISAYDRSGLLRDITAILVNEQINVMASNTRTNPTNRIARMSLSLEINDVMQLSRTLEKIAQLPNVIEVRRKSG
ncbi:MAG: GTP diphosphokinase [Candidatus Competibacteraceae bacterium]|nr:GTP diphosphokinase [Candidatus Competibacteraceae bacterium]